VREISAATVVGFALEIPFEMRLRRRASCSSEIRLNPCHHAHHIRRLPPFLQSRCRHIAIACAIAVSATGLCAATMLARKFCC
jgi:hypothetical protein